MTATEERVYDLITEPYPEYATTTVNIAATLRLQPSVVAMVCDGLEAMGFIQKYGGMWHANYVES